MVPDLRKGITSFFIQLFCSLRRDIQLHRDLVEATVFSLMTLLGSQIATFNIVQSLRGSSGIRPGGRKGRGKQTHGKGKTDIICEEESLYIQDLTGEETSWFWLEILDALWEKYLGGFGYMPNGEAGDIDSPHSTQLAPRKSMVTEAKRKLKEALLQAVVGPETEKGPGRNMRLTNVPTLNEIWRITGWDQEV